MRLNVFRFPLLFLIFFFSLITVIVPVYSKAETGISSSVTDSSFKQMGYKNFNEAVEEFEVKNKVKVELPTVFPLDVTHKFGKIDKMDGKLHLYFYNERTKEKFKIFVDFDKRTLQKNSTDRVITLQDGTEALYNDAHPSFYSLNFKKNGLIYDIFVSKKGLTKKLNTDDLVRIANSVH